MTIDKTTQQEPGVFVKNKNRDFLFDLVLYLSIMFLVREVYFSSVGFMVNGLFWSLTTLVFANWRMKVRKITWKELGLCTPRSYKTAMIATVFILGFAILSIIIFEILQAVIFGFRHSYDLSERSITVGLIGLAMGIGYVIFGRNLWPLIIAHCTLNTISMIDRVT